jgi:DNA-directed RNA polymerase specialized sigma24 family protein
VLAELRSELSAQLASLSSSQAQVVVLKDAFDYTFEEISSVAGMPVGTAKCYAHRARNSLRERLRATA